MAYLTKDKVKEIINNAPEGTTPAGIVAALRTKGHTLEGYGEQVSTPTTKTVEKKQSLLDMLKGVGQVGGEVLVGAAKGVGSTVTGLGKVSAKYLVNPVEKALGLPETKPQGIEDDSKYAAFGLPKTSITPETTAEKVGFGVEQIAEFLIPSTKVAKLEKAVGEVAKTIPKIGKIAPTLSKAAIESGVVGGQASIQEGEIGDRAKTAALVGGVLSGVGSLSYSGIKALKPIGEKIQMSTIRPSIQDVKSGFKIENVNKYNLGGSLGQTLTKANSKINELSQQLTKSLKETDAKIDLNKVFENTKNALEKSKETQFGTNIQIDRQLNNLSNEISRISDDGIVDLVKANNVKRGAGTKGAWAYGRTEPDSTAIETIYNTFYNQLKTSIEKANNYVGNAKVKEINKQLSEIIPINTAALRRLPVEQRNNVISLTDDIGLFASIFDPKALALVGANKLAKSGTFGNFLVNVSERFKPSGSVQQRFFGK